MLRDFNLIEAGLWFVLGSGCLVQSLRLRSKLAAVAGVTLVCFGVTDLIEARTGAWWRPPSLLAAKVACGIVLLVCFVRYYRARRK